jgi:hypothetical protein
MIEKESIPFAPTLIESMRSIGYSFHTALADVIDNSISANANYIDINMFSEDEPVIIILDDGCGMTNNELEEAMRYGSRNPIEKRDPNDLGRFGLGMKSASLSQCRRLTVISKKNDIVSAFIWDLDHIISKQKWSLIELSNDEINEIQYVKYLDDYISGTFLLLEKFDRIEKTTENLAKTINDKLNTTIDHLALVFHRYLDGGLTMRVNNTEIIPRDPFLTKHKSTQNRREQNFCIDGKSISVKPYILPHINKLTNDDLEIVGGKDALRSQQGFYIYRNKRLIIWGTWFNLERKHELNKLARVKVDIPNSLDYVWSIDIKKSTATLPDKIKKNLYNAVYETVQMSEVVHNYRGRKKKSFEEIDYIWERIETRTGYLYKINRVIPQLKILKETLKKEEYIQIENVLKLLEESIPATTMYLDISKGNYGIEVDKETRKQLEEIKSQIVIAKSVNMDIKCLLNAYICTEPYCKNEELKSMIREEISTYE